ncbi:MAG: DUF1573 domain-containing protein [Nibricoccus sp.]
MTKPPVTFKFQIAPSAMFCRLSVLFFLLPVVVASASLRFTTTDLVVKAGPQDKELQAQYTFTNSGPAPVWIVQLATSCGCTKATADKTEYQPGETGVITATYTIGLSQGRHTHTISLQTSEPDTPPYVLKITADLPSGGTPLTTSASAIVVTPRELVWSRPPYTSKTITIVVNDVASAKLTATCDNDQFELKLEETVTPATLQVTPKPSAASTRAEITLQLARPDHPPLTQKIPLTLVVLKAVKAK